MTTLKGWVPSLRYSPVNGIIINWAHGAAPFSMCGMPQPACKGASPTPATPAEACCPGPEVPEVVDTYDWFRWIPETAVGIEGVPEDMVASYARRAAIRFATRGWVLQRQVALKVQPGVIHYPLEPFEGERVIGVVGVESAPQVSQHRTPGPWEGSTAAVRVDEPRQRLVVTPSAEHCRQAVKEPWLLVTVYAAPTEVSCKHDVFLWDRYREDITVGARAMLISEVQAYGSYRTSRGQASARGDAYTFGRADRMMADFDRRIAQARRAVTAVTTVTAPPPELWNAPRGLGAMGIHR